MAREPATQQGPKVYGVGELARRIKGTLEAEFGEVLVRGEISNLRQPGSGHLYFSLKDDAGSLRAVLFRGQARLLRFRPENGQEVVARGRIGFYEASGDAQIVCSWLDPVGAGALALAFEQRKAKLQAEGLFDEARKRPLPFLPRRVGVVTSPTGAAIHDFVRILHRRFPRIEVLIAPARVQGAGAAEEIAAGVERLGARGDCDLVVVTRGGGSIEDLWAFNEEVVARAIAACPAPVVSAVGHEVDVTIADFVADVRAPTPSGAAELIAPVERELRAALAVARSRLHRATVGGLEARRARAHRLLARLGDPSRRIADERLSLDGRRQRACEAIRARLRDEGRALVGRQEALRRSNPVAKLQIQSRRLARLSERLRHAGRAIAPRRRETLRLLARELRSPRERILGEARRLGSLRDRLDGATSRTLREKRSRLEERAAELRALSPLRVLARGYSIAFAASGAVLYRADDAKPGDRLHLELRDGALEVEVKGRAAPRKPSAGADAEGDGAEPAAIDPRAGGR
ncbi:MAG TPA: exodeoxyribonuclease VII large subunit [Vulgatibacter sp.]|nr:exodeoxyribonuclease VII large subunit [Vulgatibacter sp.]